MAIKLSVLELRLVAAAEAVTLLWLMFDFELRYVLLLAPYYILFFAGVVFPTPPLRPGRPSRNP
jgi:hypothetical protein